MNTVCVNRSSFLKRCASQVQPTYNTITIPFRLHTETKEKRCSNKVKSQTLFGANGRGSSLRMKEPLWPSVDWRASHIFE